MCGSGNTCCGGGTSGGYPPLYCSSKACCQPYQANIGFSIGSGNTDLLRVYKNNLDWYPIVDGLVNNIGSKWWQIGDQVHLHINLVFTSTVSSNTINMTGLPVPVKVDTYPSNGAIIELGFNDPSVLHNGQLRYNAGDLSSLDIYDSTTTFVIGNTYTLNAQIVYNTSST